MIKAIVFDLDGVLVDAAEWHYRALSRALAAFGFHIPPEEHARRFNGLPTRVKLGILSRDHGLEPELHEAINLKKQALTWDIFAENCRPRPDLAFLLRTLRERGYRLAVATNSSRSTLDMVVDRMRIKRMFDVLSSHEDVGRPKPSPEIYYHTFRRLELRAEQCLVIEDSAPGIEAARLSGARVLTVRDPGDVTLERILNALTQFPHATSTIAPSIEEFLS
jgi:HAD superfamily hydrolase (TIGR01509 family)